MERVVVTGLDYVTSLGFGHEDHEAALRHGRGGPAPITRFSTDGFRTRVAGQCDERRLEQRLAKRWSPAVLRRLGVDTRLILWALASAIESAGLPVGAPARPLPAFLGTTTEGFHGAEQWFAQHLLDPRRARPHHLVHASAGSQLSTLAGLLRTPLEPCVMTNACATGISSIGRLFRSIRHGRRELGVAGGYDCLTRFVHLGFDSLGALTTGRCAPFERGRSGFFIGDGAAVLVMESLTHARSRGARIRAEIVGYGESADSHHQTHPDPEGRGIARAMRRALASAEMEPGRIDYINAHGTGTPANDGAEARGTLLGLGPDVGRRVPISSTKPLVGHTLGAAGAVEQCFCLLALERGFLPPQAGFVEGDPACPLNIVREAKGQPAVVMNSSLGFGGANGVLIARRWEEVA